MCGRVCLRVLLFRPVEMEGGGYPMRLEKKVKEKVSGER